MWLVGPQWNTNFKSHNNLDFVEITHIWGWIRANFWEICGYYQYIKEKLTCPYACPKPLHTISCYESDVFRPDNYTEIQFEFQNTNQEYFGYGFPGDTDIWNVFCVQIFWSFDQICVFRYSEALMNGNWKLTCGSFMLLNVLPNPPCIIYIQKFNWKMAQKLWSNTWMDDNDWSSSHIF